MTFNVNSGTTLIYGGYVGEGTTGSLTGALPKIGSGTYAARHFRVNELIVDEGTLRATQELTGLDPGTLNTSRVGTISVGSSGKFDLINNGLIIDYESGSNPLSDPPTSGFVSDLHDGWAGGSWNGNGIISSLAQGADPERGLGYAQKTDLGWTTFAGLTLDDTSIPVRLTLMGDSNLDKTVDFSDFSLLASHFGTDNYWYNGDYDYTGHVDIGDFAMQAANFNETLSPPRRPDGQGRSSVFGAISHEDS